MKTMPALVTLALTLASACATAPATQPDVALPGEVTAAGDTVYYGTVYPLEPAAADKPLYVYERRVAAREDATVAAHITRDLAGKVVFADSAKHGADYRLQDYTLHGNQLGQSGRISVHGDQVRFHRVCPNGVKDGVETQTDPVVVGPTLVGYMFQHLDQLRAGKKLPVRLAVLDRMETIGFELEVEPADARASAGQTRVRMKASSFLVAALIDPFYFTFETSTGKLVRLEGRVPPKVRDGDQLRDLDARVEYQFVAAAYR